MASPMGKSSIVTAISTQLEDWLKENGKGDLLTSLYEAQAEYRKNRPTPAYELTYYHNLTDDKLARARKRGELIAQRATAEQIRRLQTSTAKGN